MTEIDGWIDFYIAQFFHPVCNSFLKFFILFLNRSGKGDALFFLCLVLMIIGYFSVKPRFIKSGAAGILTLSISGILVQLLKHLFGRARPQMNLGDFHFIGPNLLKDGFDSFPSGHALSSFTVASFFSYFYPRFRILFYSIAAAISIFGRVLMRHHFLSDVIAGGAIGIFVGLFFAKKFSGWIEREKISLDNPDNEPNLQTTPSDSPLNLRGNTGGLTLENNLSNRDTHNDSSAIHLLIITFFSSLILFTGLKNSALWDRDETEYAQAAIEMNQRNEWLIPTLEGEPFVEKPVLLYWCTRLSTRFFGMNELAFRFPSVIFGILTCIGTYFLGKKIGGRNAGLFSALILSSSFLFAGGFRLLMTDPLFVFFSVLSFLFYLNSLSKSNNTLRHCEESSTKQSLFLRLPRSLQSLAMTSEKRNLLFSYLSVGLSVLSKGPIGFFPVVVFFLFEWIQKKNLPRSFIKHSFLSLIPILIAAPWFIYSFSVHKEATSSFFIYDNILRFFDGMEGHTGPMFYYIPVLLIGFFPWSFFMIPCLKNEWQIRRSIGTPMKPEIFLISLWISFLFIFFSITANKLPHYILPALPPLACLLGKFWSEQIEQNSCSLKPFILSSIIFATSLAIALISFYWIRPQYASFRLVFPFLILLFFLTITHFWNEKKEPKKVFYSTALGSLFLFVSFSVWGLPWIDGHRVTKPIGLAIEKYAASDSKLLGYHFSEPSLFIYGGKLFPKMEEPSLDEILKNPEPTYVVVTESKLKESSPKTPYMVLEKKSGFAENSGEITLMLISNKRGSE